MQDRYKLTQQYNKINHRKKKYINIFFDSIPKGTFKSLSLKAYYVSNDGTSIVFVSFSTSMGHRPDKFVILNFFYDLTLKFLMPFFSLSEPTMQTYFIIKLFP